MSEDTQSPDASLEGTPADADAPASPEPVEQAASGSADGGAASFSPGPSEPGSSDPGSADSGPAEAESTGGAPSAAQVLDDVLGEPQAPAPSAEVKAVVEALVFASPEPIALKTLQKVLADEPKEEVAAALQALAAEYENRPGLQMVEVAGGYQIVTRPQLHEWVRRLFHERSTQKLSTQALETLALVAYRQPITAAEVTEIRGVNASGVLTTLLERHLVKIVGRRNVVGRPFVYATTREFLIRFGLKDLAELPRIEDVAEALGFEPPAGLIEQTPREEVLPLDEPDSEPEPGPDATAATAADDSPVS